MSSGLIFTGLEANGYLDQRTFHDDATGVAASVELMYFPTIYGNIQSRLTVAERGGKETLKRFDESGNSLENYTGKFSFNYISFSTAYQLVMKINGFRPTVSIGPRIDYLIFSTVNNPKFTTTNYGVDFSLGLQKELTSKMFFDIQWIWSPQFKSIVSDPSFSLKPKEGYAFMFGFGYSM